MKVGIHIFKSPKRWTLAQLRGINISFFMLYFQNGEANEYQTSEYWTSDTIFFMVER